MTDTHVQDHATTSLERCKKTYPDMAPFLTVR